MGVQGGFLVVRPNQTDFDNMVRIILSGGSFRRGSGWGGKLNYGGYYGSGTIQGLASYYYGEFAKNRSVELNRCYYNSMVDDPMGIDKSKEGQSVQRCRTLEEECEDCQKTDLSKVKSVHFTVCGKPDRCRLSPKKLCTQLHGQYHSIRLSLEEEWMKKYPFYRPAYVGIQSADERYAFTKGHCQRNYFVPLEFPWNISDGMT